jgi:hypothetical protein
MHRILVVNPEGKSTIGIILNCVQTSKVLTVWTELSWVRTGSSGGLLNTVYFWTGMKIISVPRSLHGFG